MNQAILFPEREWWDAETGAVCFTALVNGFPVTCAIDGATLLRRRVSQDDPLACFQQCRWDIEEEAERTIRQGNEDNQGWVWLS